MRLDEADTSTQTEEASSPDGKAGWQNMLRERAAAVGARIDWSWVALGASVLLALYLRLFNINWDANNHLHPDERKITMVAMCLGLKSVPAGCPAVPDPANPHFFAYGSFPMYLLALVSHGLAAIFHGWHGLPTDGGTFDDYNHITLVGRALSALFDTGTVLVTALIVRRLVGRWWGVFAALFLAFTAFEVQVSHFYAVDTVLTFFVTLALFGAIGLATVRRDENAEPDALPPVSHTIGWAILTGLAFGLAMSSKVSALPLLVPIILALIIRWKRLGLAGWSDISIALLTIATTAFVFFTITMPYFFLDPTSFWHDVNEQSQLASGKIVYPYTIQFAGTTPYLYQLKNIFIWDMGIPLAVAGFAGLLYGIARLWRRWDDILLIPVSWVVIYFGITGDFYLKFSRYELPIFPMLAVLAAVGLAALANNRQLGERWQATRRLVARLGAGWTRKLAFGLAAVVILSGFLLTAAFLNIYTQPVTRVTASEWIYRHVPPNSDITSEIWDDALPLSVDNNAPYQYQNEGLDLYQPDTTDKATTLAGQINKADIIVLSSNRLKGSIEKVPDTYPLTVHYYHLLFAGKLGFHLTATFANEPHLGPFALPDSQADESFSVYDHPTVWIFTRDAGPRMTADQERSLLMAGVSLPPEVTSLASQKTLLLSQQQIAADNATPPLWQTFNPQGLATTLALPLWWLAVELLGLLAFPLLYLALPGLRDRGWGLAKALGVLLLSFFIWLPANFGILPYERATVWLVFVLLAALAVALYWWRRDKMKAFFREQRNIIIVTEVIVLVAFLFFVGIRSLDPDLWHIYRGGEKPMELTFLNGILRSRTLPPLDPWFFDGYINYYYFGQFLIATLIQLTGIVPTTAFNLAIPMLFALTISGAISVVGGLTGRWWQGIVAGLFLAVAGNLDGLGQLIGQIQALAAHLPLPLYDYWRSSRVIPYTINEFPFWSFLYADLHAHVIDLPIALIGMGIAASLFKTTGGSAGWPAGRSGASATDQRWRILTLALAALVLGAMACINTWDAPTYGGIIIIALLLSEWRALTQSAQPRPDDPPWLDQLVRSLLAPPIVLSIIAGAAILYWIAQSDAQSLIRLVALAGLAGIGAGLAIIFCYWNRHLVTWPVVRRIVLSVVGVGAGAILLYLPFYTHFQNFVNGIGPVATPDSSVLYLIVFGVWLFIIASFFLVEIRDRWEGYIVRHRDMADGAEAITDTSQRMLAIVLAAVIVLTLLVLVNLKLFLLGLIAVAVFLAVTGRNNPAKQLIYLLVIVGLGLSLLFESIYLRDFLDGIPGWERMNTVFKFSYQVWLLFALSAALALGQIIGRVFDFSFVRAAFAARRETVDVGDAEATQSEIGDEEALPGEDEDLSAPESHESRPIATWPGKLPSFRTGEDAVVGVGLRGAWIAVMLVLLIGSSVFLFEGTNARLQDRTNWGPYVPVNAMQSVPSLNGFAYMHTWFPGDADAITWMNEHIGGDPTIVEASLNPYQWYGRVTIYTGLPAVLGWGNHEGQQRYIDEVSQRQQDVTTIFSAGNTDIVLPLLQRYNVKYVYVGEVECLDYGLGQNDLTKITPDQISKCAQANDLMGPLTVFQQLVDQGVMRVAYQKEGVTIYEMVR